MVEPKLQPTLADDLARIAGGFCYQCCPHGTEQNWPHDPACVTMQSAVTALSRDHGTQPIEAAETVERLRLLAAWRKPGGTTPAEKCPDHYGTITAAADALEAISAENAKLQEALEDIKRATWAPSPGEVDDAVDYAHMRALAALKEPRA